MTIDYIGEFIMVIKVEVFSTNSCPHCPAAIEAAQSAKDKLTLLLYWLSIFKIK